MTLFAVSRHAGPAWIEDASAFEQPAVEDHVSFMNELEQSGGLLFAGPLDGTERGRIRVLLVADAADAAEVRATLARDPWEQVGRMVTDVVEPWTLLVGAARMPSTTP